MIPPPSIAYNRILSKLGEGGMAAVYRAMNTRLNREVAVKLLRPVGMKCGYGSRQNNAGFFHHSEKNGATTRPIASVLM